MLLVLPPVVSICPQQPQCCWIHGCPSELNVKQTIYQLMTLVHTSCVIFLEVSSLYIIYNKGAAAGRIPPKTTNQLQHSPTPTPCARLHRDIERPINTPPSTTTSLPGDTHTLNELRVQYHGVVWLGLGKAEEVIPLGEHQNDIIMVVYPHITNSCLPSAS